MPILSHSCTDLAGCNGRQNRHRRCCHYHTVGYRSASRTGQRTTTTSARTTIATTTTLLVPARRRRAEVDLNRPQKHRRKQHELPAARASETASSACDRHSAAPVSANTQPVRRSQSHRPRFCRLGMLRCFMCPLRACYSSNTSGSEQHLADDALK